MVVVILKACILTTLRAIGYLTSGAFNLSPEFNPISGMGTFTTSTWDDIGLYLFGRRLFLLVVFIALDVSCGEILVLFIYASVGFVFAPTSPMGFDTRANRIHCCKMLLECYAVSNWWICDDVIGKFKVSKKTKNISLKAGSNMVIAKVFALTGVTMAHLLCCYLRSRRVK